MKTLYIFTRDLRINDNIALNKCIGDVYPIFILNPVQLTGDYCSLRAIEFMYDSLALLQSYIPLQIYKGSPEVIVKTIVHLFDYVVITKDYTPFAKRREDTLRKVCGDKLYSYHGHLLTEFNDDPYRKFTPFYNSITKVIKPVTKHIKFVKLTTDKLSPYNLGKRAKLYIPTNLQNIHLATSLCDKSSELSRYLKFGVLSIREVYQSVKDQEVKRQLLWRDFYTLIMNKYNGEPMRDIKWDNTNFNKWKLAKTGVPIVDACMNQLNTTGFISNRARLIVADYLVNHLHVDWRLGEKHFAQQLIDYDYAINNYNWQWVVMNGNTRKLNPAIQAKKYDKNGLYVNKWVKN